MAEDFSQFPEVEDFSQFPEVTEEKTLSGFGENLATDAANLGGAVVDMVASPLDTAGAVTDLAVTGATNLLPESVVDDLYSYENDPSSMQYK